MQTCGTFSTTRCLFTFFFVFGFYILFFFALTTFRFSFFVFVSSINNNIKIFQFFTRFTLLLFITFVSINNNSNFEFFLFFHFFGELVSHKITNFLSDFNNILKSISIFNLNQQLTLFIRERKCHGSTR